MGIDVPLSPLTLVKKIDLKANIVIVKPGQYAHFGIEQSLRKAALILDKYEEILCDVNIDGLPIFKSSNTQLWPILIKVVNIKKINIFPILKEQLSKLQATIEHQNKVIVEMLAEQKI